uniref:Putative glyoxysomal processing protease, glyoxysomal n=1 Tax=Davidia involucrata TaxID=16924 RepID=A0A5B7BU36_DAVIN
MGLPEIVDVARNFAVMVRVLGPDPKGLKMRKHAFHQYNSGETTLSASGMLLPGSLYVAPLAKQFPSDNDTQSLLSSALVVTVASIVEPFLLLQHRENSSQAKSELIPGVQIDIMVEGKAGVKDDAKVSGKGAPHWLPAQLLKLVDIPVSSIALQSLVEASSGSLEHGWEAGWSLASNDTGPQSFMDVIRSQNQRQLLGGEASNPSLMGKSITRIALLRVASVIVKDLPNLNISPSKRRGDLLLAMGSPFGILSPLHFFNSISVGSIANIYPPSSSTISLLMADVRCLPGMEGGPIFGDYAELIGILTKPLRQKTSGAEIQLVIPWEAIATACSDLLQEEPQNAWKGIHYNNGNLNAVGKTRPSNSLDLDGSTSPIHEHHNSGHTPPSSVEKAMASICLVTIDDGAWASGVLLNNQGLILTNAHLLEPWRFGKATANGERNESKSEVLSTPSNESVPPWHEGVGGHQRSHRLLPTKLKTADSSVGDQCRTYKPSFTNISHRSIHVRLDNTDPWIWCDARVVYVSEGPLDVALLQLEFVPDQLCPIAMDFTCPSPGSKAYVIGHGLFGPQCDFSPSACLGVVAKVVEAKRPLHYQYSLQENALGYFPVMLETTAAVHPGGSGGAVVSSDGHMIGLVTSNARHGGGTVIPHLNFSISCAALEPIFKFSKDMQDLSLLEDLDKPNEHLSSVWALMSPLSPKPGPSLPDLPQSLPGDNNKDGKGSRFAKFIAERHEVLKNTAQLGKLERRSTKFIPSKL